MEEVKDSIAAVDSNLDLSIDHKKRTVMDAIKEQGLRVTTAQIAATTGFAINEVNRTLNGIAAETGAVLQVASDGTLFYCFADNFIQRYALTGLKRDVQNSLVFIARAAFYVARISFGVVLVVSILVAILLIIIALCSLVDNGGGGGDFGGGGGGGDFNVGSSGSSGSRPAARPRRPKKSKQSSGFFDLQSFSDAFSWNYTPTHQRKLEKYKKGNFFLECFSFLFGDGDPNAHLEEEKWQLIANTIEHNGGVVTADQLAPYTGIDPCDDACVLPVLQRFDGVPVVTDSGNIVYSFEQFRWLPSLDADRCALSTSSVSSSHVINHNGAEKSKPCLKEETWVFTQYSGLAMFNVTLLATINLTASWWLFKHIATIAVLYQYTLVIDFLLGYGALFLLIPFLRIFFNFAMNAGIRARNIKRWQFADRLANLVSPQLRAKLSEAKSIGSELAHHDEQGVEKRSQIIYSSQRDLLEQQLEMASGSLGPVAEGG